MRRRRPSASADRASPRISVHSVDDAKPRRPALVNAVRKKVAQPRSQPPRPRRRSDDVEAPAIRAGPGFGDAQVPRAASAAEPLDLASARSPQEAAFLVRASPSLSMFSEEVVRDGVVAPERRAGTAPTSQQVKTAADFRPQRAQPAEQGVEVDPVRSCAYLDTSSTSKDHEERTLRQPRYPAVRKSEQR